MNARTRNAALASLVLAAGAALWFMAQESRDPPAVAVPDAALADEVRRLRRENAELRERLDRRPRARAEPPAATPADAKEEASPASPDGAAEPVGPLLRARQAVRPDGPPAETLDADTVADLLSHLRTAVSEKRNADVTAIENALARRGSESVDALMTLVRDATAPDDVRDAALRVLASLDAPGLASLVENLYLGASGQSKPPAARRALALKAAVAADPQAAIPVVQRLLWSSDPADRETAMSGLAAARDPALLPLMREQVMRPDAGPSAVALSDAIAALRGRRWSALQATGAPDTPAAGDIGAAWASKAADMGEVWLELDFEVAVTPGALRIRETYNPGAVARVEAVFEDGRRETLWEGRAAVETAPRWFDPSLKSATSRVRTIRIVLDTDRVPGWNEIDAVELVGDGRRQWAGAARASSSYSDP